MRLLTSAGTALGLLLVVGGGWVTYEEGVTYLSGGETSTERLLGMLGHQAPPGVSMPSRRAALLDCHGILSSINSLQMRYLPVESRDQIVSQCRSLADGIAAGAPTDALAWYVSAFAAAVQSDWSRMDTALQQSQSVGPNEQWVAELRAALAEDHYSHLSPGTLAGHDADLKLLVTSGIGIRSMARRYVTDPGFRERIITLVETFSPLDQRRFATNVRLQAQSIRQLPD